MKKTLGIILALGDLYGDAGEGELHRPLDGGVSRIEAAIARMVPATCSLLVCSAGYSKEDPGVPSPERLASLAEQAARFIYERHDSWIHYLVARPLCWSTRNEVRVGIKVALLEKFATRDEKVRVVIATNLSHMPRVWLYTKLCAPKNWRVELVRARHQFSLMSHLLEAPKLARDIVYTLRVFYRLWRRS